MNPPYNEYILISMKKDADMQNDVVEKRLTMNPE
jgi:hypothetical protein